MPDRAHETAISLPDAAPTLVPPPFGIVTAIAPGFAEVWIEHETLLCTYRGRLRRALVASAPPAPASHPPRRSAGAGARPAATPQARDRSNSPTGEAPTRLRVAPGDFVRVRALGPGTGVVEELLPRRSELARSGGEAGGAHVMLANIDHAALVFAVRDPLPHFGMLDRYLALCERAGIDVTICLNKVDLGLPETTQQAAALYADLGYAVLCTSAVSGAHLDELRARLGGRVSLLSGPSGVGKSSLVNALLPQVGQRTSPVSASTGKGRHTTTGARLLPLPEGGWLADSAGIRELALWNVPADELARCFVELRPVADQCLYEDCAHSVTEDGCALRAAQAEGRISADRFASFESLLREARGVP